MSFSVNHEVGLLIDPFDEPPFIRMTYNPPYYAGLIEGYGLRKIQDLYAYAMFESEGFPKRLRDIAGFVLEDPKLVVRTMDVRDFKNERDRIKKIYTEAWSENWGAVPLTEEEFDHIVGEFKLIFDRDLSFIAEYDGEPAGMSLVLPDMNQALKKAGGRLFPLGLLKLLWHRRKINSWRMPVLGVLKKHRMRGIEAVLCCRTYDAAKRNQNYRKCELSWILESNTAANSLLTKMGARRSKTYRIYEKPLPRGAAPGASGDRRYWIHRGDPRGGRSTRPGPCRCPVRDTGPRLDPGAFVGDDLVQGTWMKARIPPAGHAWSRPGRPCGRGRRGRGTRGSPRQC